MAATISQWNMFYQPGVREDIISIVDSGIKAGVGTDSTNVAALDPWLSLFYMTTGRNLAGVETNAGQKISRLEALRLYTDGAAWFSFDDHHVGSFVEGKYADLAALSFPETVQGAIVSRITNDVEALDQLVTDGVTSLVQNTLLLVGTAIVLFFLDWRLALATLTVVPLTPVIVNVSVPSRPRLAAMVTRSGSESAFILRIT